jgi:acetyl esterase/lipase
VGTKELKLNVFSPVADEHPEVLLPAIIFFHGGGWVSGNRTYFNRQCRYFAKHGMVAVTADYRLMKKGAAGIDGTKEICIRDAKSATRWVRSHSAALHIDLNKIIVGGGSAGGYLATMATLDHQINDPLDDTTISTHANALVLFNPAYNLRRRALLQPFRLVSAEVPPVIMFFGSKDKWKHAADTLYAMLKNAGVKSEMWVANGQTHAFFNKNPWNLATCVKAHEFLVECGLMKAGKIPGTPSGGTLVRKY